MGTTLLLFGIALFAGTLGAILGIGGGAILIPALTLGFGVPIRYAIGASIVSVIATSSGAAASYVREKMTNIRIAVFLEIATTLGALAGVTVATYLNPKVLYLVFGGVLLQSAYSMWKKKETSGALIQFSHPWAVRLGLNGDYWDSALKKQIAYSVKGVPLGFLYMLSAGLLSGMLGIGSGILKVLAMDRAMGLPIKVSSATSNFMMGVTAAASAGVYYVKGDIIPELATPVALGVLCGSILGARLMPLLPSQSIRKAFVFVLIIIAFQMIFKGLR